MLACAPFAPDKRLPEKELVPESYSNSSPEAEIRQRWWESFQNEQLNALVEEALTNNYTLRQSWARLKQARALAVQQGADLYPDLTLDGGATTGRRQTTNGGTATESVESYAIGLGSSYEIDLWGRIRSDKEAAALSAAASREDLNAAAITLAANVTSRWVGIVSQRMQMQLLQQQLEANQTLVELVELRFRKSLASALDVFQQRQLVEQSRAQIPLVEQSERLLMNELTLLLGRTSLAFPDITTSDFEIPSEVPPSGIPVQLMTARPDIQAALRRLESSDWSLAAAKADRLPSISLRAGAGYGSDDLELLFDNWLIDLTANLTAPLFDGGRRKAEVERLQALVEEDLAAYRQVVLTAVREVEDALVSEEKLKANLKGLQAQLDAANNALTEAGFRYRNGLIDYLPVLTQLLTVQSLERTIIQRKADLLLARVNLYRALGGTWPQQMKPREQN